MSPHEMSAASAPENACPNGSPEPGEGSSRTDLILPPNDSFSPITDDRRKPEYKYHQLIAMAILRSPMRRLTLKEIYKWISDTYSFYEPGQEWQNRVRHSLSMHKEFIKTKRQEGDPGLGGYWEIKPGNESKLLRKSTRKAASTKGCLISISPEPSNLTKAPMGVPPPHPPAPTSQIPHHPPKQFPEDVMTRSSDVLPLAGSSSDSSLDSSPVPRRSQARNGTCNPSLRIQSLPPKRKLASTDMALAKRWRTPQTFYLTQMAELYRGRAEVEIARIRSSTTSPESILEAPAFLPTGQSQNVGTNPTSTPAMRVNPLFRPPPSPSPGTSGYIGRKVSHRGLQSTLPPLADIGGDNRARSSFSLNDDGNIFDIIQPSIEFDIFQDHTPMRSPLAVGVRSVDSGSLVKRPPLDGPTTTVTLADITNSVKGLHHTSTPPVLKPAEGCSSYVLEAPNKACEEPEWPLEELWLSPSP